MNLLITGGAGSLGSNIVENLGHLYDKIVVLDNFATGKRESLPPVANLQIIEGSVCDESLVTDVFDTYSPEHVIHSAASYKDPNDWIEDSRTNVMGSIVVGRAAERVGVKRLINFQTALCYGRPDIVPVPVTHPSRPFTSYGISKTAGESFLRALSIPVVSLRLANVTGPRLAIGPIPAFYKRLKSGEGCSVSTTTRDFLDMSDFLSLLALTLQDGAPTGVFNVSTGEGHTIGEIFDLVAEHLQIPDARPVAINPPGADDVAAVVLDSSHTETTFGWKAHVSFADTIRRMLDWYDRHGITDIYSHLQEKK